MSKQTTQQIQTLLNSSEDSIPEIPSDAKRNNFEIFETQLN